MNPHDRAILSPPTRYATADEAPEQWIAQVREIIRRDGHKVRAGFPACIEVHGSLGWQPLNLWTNGVEFTGKRDRDAVLRRLVE